MKRIPVALPLFFVIFVTLMLSAYQPVFSVTEKTTGNASEIETLRRQIEENNKKIQQLEETIAQVKKNIAAKQLQTTSLKNQVVLLDSRINEVELNIELTQEKLDTVTLEIGSMEEIISDKEQLLHKQKKLVAELLRTVQKNDQKKYLEILATYDHFSDFYNQLQYTRNTEQELGTQIIALRKTKETLTQKRDETDERKKTYVTLKDRLDALHQDLSEQIHNKKQLLTETKASELTYQTLLGNLRKQYQQTENEITQKEKQVRLRLAEQDRLSRLHDAESNGLLSWPTQSRYITAYFHDPGYPFRNVFEHNAVDIRASFGTAIHAAASGYIGQAKRCTTSSCYSYVMIIHGGGISTVYGHMSRIDVVAEQFVTRGDIIGATGGTPGTVGAGPFVTGPHLHFEVRKSGIPNNPLDYLIHDY